MRALRIEEPRRLTVVAEQTPIPGPGELLVRVAACGVCGTDLHIYEGSYMGSYPVIPGHEFAGTAVLQAPGVSEQPAELLHELAGGRRDATRRGSGHR